MKINLKLFDKTTLRHVDPSTDKELGNELMTQAGLITQLDCDGFGITDYGDVVIFDNCGNFGYVTLDPAKYSIHIQYELESKADIQENISQLVPD